MTHLGTVARFDERRGLGTITPAQALLGGQPEIPFHCTAIANGTRTIPEGIAVAFTLVPGSNGTWEAAGIVASSEDNS